MPQETSEREAQAAAQRHKLRLQTEEAKSNFSQASSQNAVQEALMKQQKKGKLPGVQVRKEYAMGR